MTTPSTERAILTFNPAKLPAPASSRGNEFNSNRAVRGRTSPTTLGTAGRVGNAPGSGLAAEKPQLLRVMSGKPGLPRKPRGTKRNRLTSNGTNSRTSSNSCDSPDPLQSQNRQGKTNRNVLRLSLRLGLTAGQGRGWMESFTAALNCVKTLFGCPETSGTGRAACPASRGAPARILLARRRRRETACYDT